MYSLPKVSAGVKAPVTSQKDSLTFLIQPLTTCSGHRPSEAMRHFLDFSNDVTAVCALTECFQKILHTLFVASVILLEVRI